MTTKISPLLYEVLSSNDTAAKESAQVICDILDHNEQDEVIQWKAIMCLSAFPSEQTTNILEIFCRKADLRGREAKRALQLINQF